MCSYIWFAIHPLFIKKNPTFDSSKEKREKKRPQTSLKTSGEEMKYCYYKDKVRKT